MDIQKEREGFENHLKKMGKTDNETFSKDEDDSYQMDIIHFGWKIWQAAKAQAVPEGFGLFDGDTLTYSNEYSINCSFDDEFDCHIFDVYQNEDCVKDGMTQLEQAHCLVLSMIKLDAKDSMIEAQEPSND